MNTDIIWYISIFLLILLAYYLYCNNNNKDEISLEKQNITNSLEMIDNRVYICKDKNDKPASCNTYGIGNAILNKYKDSNAPCPKNWLEPGNSIYN